MTTAEYQRKHFWALMEKELKEQGEPFSIRPQYSGNSVRHYASIMKGEGVNLDVNFLTQDGILRICLYIHNRPELYEFLKEKREVIENILGFSVAFSVGEKNKDVKWVKREWGFIPFDSDDYTRALKRALPDMIKFVKAFKAFL